MGTEPLGSEEYGVTQTQILLIARMLSSLDLDGFLSSIERVDTLGPILDPTTYRDALALGAGDNLLRIRRIARLARQMGAEYSTLMAQAKRQEKARANNTLLAELLDKTSQRLK